MRAYATGSAGALLARPARSMSEFEAAARAAEDKRKRGITDAIAGRLAQMYEPQTCRQCGREFVPLEDLGRRRCRMHPLAPNPVSSSGPVDDPALWAEHYPCCGAAATDAPCACEHARIPVDCARGCVSGDHSERGMPFVRPMQTLTTHRVDMQRPYEDFAKLLHVEPLFLLRRVALERGLPSDASHESLRALLGTSAFLRVLDVRDIAENRARCETLQVGGGCVRLRVNVRNAYVAMAQRYRLPCAVTRKNFASAPTEAPGKRDTAARLQNLVKRAFGAAASATQQQPSSDIVLLDEYGRAKSASSGGGEMAFGQDEYYDVAEIFYEREASVAPARKRPRRDTGSAISMAREITRAVASNESETSFYPFVVWSWLG